MRDGLVWVHLFGIRSTISVDHVWAIVLVVALALWALEASPDLSSDANTVSHFASFYSIPNLDGLADDLVADADGHRCVTPASSDGVDIRAADAAALDLDIDIMLAELLGFELRRKVKMTSNQLHTRWTYLLLAKVGPFLLVVDHETLEGIWVTHFESWYLCAVVDGCSRGEESDNKKEKRYVEFNL